MTCNVKPSDVYARRPRIPEGKKVIAFRRPEVGELFIMDTGGHMIADCIDLKYLKLPRLILADCEPEVDWWE